jgi:hypothetical protein
MLKAFLFCLRTFAVLAVGSLSLQAADMKVDLTKLPPAADKPGLTYAKDIQPMLKESCLKCHGPERPRSRYRIDSLQAIAKAGALGQAPIVAGESVKSPLVLYIADAVEEMEMPPLDTRDKYPPLTREQIGVIRAWIDQGAK